MRKSTHTGDYAQLRELLTTIRQRSELSQRQLARRLRVPHTWVAKVESGERRLDLVEFAWFCAACDANPAAEASRLIIRWQTTTRTSSHARSARR